MKFLVTFTLISLFLSCNITTNETEAKSEPEGNMVSQDSTVYGDMKQYWLVFLLKGPNRSHDSASSAKIQAAHLANIDRLAKEGKIVMAGPMGYGPGQDKDLRGIFIMDAPDSTQAAGYINTDSAVITGRLRFEIHPWWTAKGRYIFR